MSYLYSVNKFFDKLKTKIMTKLKFSQLPTAAKNHALKMWMKYNNRKGRTEQEVLKMLEASDWLYNRRGEFIDPFATTKFYPFVITRS